MYERILVAIDHSPATARVLAAARDLALLSQGEVWVVHVREHQGGGRAGVIAAETIDEAHDAADASVAELTSAGVKAHADIRYAFKATPPARSPTAPGPTTPGLSSWARAAGVTSRALCWAARRTRSST